MNCTKIYPKHQRLSPGLLVMVCKHKICYGFQILRRRESTTMVFNLLLTLFQKQPSLIIYDNACNLHNTCMIRYVIFVKIETSRSPSSYKCFYYMYIYRDPKLFRRTTFLIDRFHSRNHRCNPSYSMNSIKTDYIKQINSQVCEQLFSTLRRISTQVAYMRTENLFFNVRYFLACLNREELSKLI